MEQEQGRDLPGGAKTPFERAEQITRAQIELALQLNAKYFDGEGLEHFGAILQALAQTYHAERIRIAMK